MIKTNSSKFKFKGDGYRELNRTDANRLIKGLKSFFKQYIKDEKFWNDLEKADVIKVKLNLDYTFKPKEGNINKLSFIINFDGTELKIVDTFRPTMGLLLEYYDNKIRVKSSNIYMAEVIEVLSYFIPLNYNKDFEVSENA